MVYRCNKSKKACKACKSLAPPLDFKQEKQNVGFTFGPRFPFHYRLIQNWDLCRRELVKACWSLHSIVKIQGPQLFDFKLGILTCACTVGYRFSNSFLFYLHRNSYMANTAGHFKRLPNWRGKVPMVWTLNNFIAIVGQQGEELFFIYNTTAHPIIMRDNWKDI